MSAFGSDGESAVYAWAMRNGVPDPAGFSYMYAEEAEDEEFLRRMARRAKLEDLNFRKSILMEERRELDIRIKGFEDRIRAIEEEEL